MKILVLLSLLLCINGSIQAQFNHYFDTITFEESYPYFENDTAAQNIWQIGVPQKIYFDSAFTPTQAILTDTINNYPVNNHSYFDIKIGAFNYGFDYGYDVFLLINHKYETDSLLDGCFITVSYDSGQTWTNIINDTSSWLGYWCQTPRDGTTMNFYNNYSDSLFNGEWGFSGKSNGWIQSTFGWHECPVKTAQSGTLPDTMLVRFNFISDSIDTNKEGWMIDEIVLYAIPLGSNVDAIPVPTFQVYPNPASDFLTIETEKEHQMLEVYIYSLSGTLLKKNSVEQTQSLQVKTNDLPAGNYWLSVEADGKRMQAKMIRIE